MIHGTGSAYTHGACRCATCRTAQSRRKKIARARARLLAGAEPATVVAAGPARRHIAQLAAAGLSQREIARRAGVGHVTVGTIAGGRRRGCSAITRRLILAVEADR